jgi:hypothetical protein
VDVQSIVPHGRMAPHPRHPLILADDCTVCEDQREQDVEGGWAQSDGLTVANQLAPVRVEDKFAEANGFPWRRGFRQSQAPGDLRILGRTRRVLSSRMTTVHHP